MAPLSQEDDVKRNFWPKLKSSLARLPFDVVPDFLLGIGFTDDAAVLFGALTAIRAHMNQSHRDKARETLGRLRAETLDASPL
jgi:hypothetical protein